MGLYIHTCTIRQSAYIRYRFRNVSYQQLTTIDDDFVLGPLCCCSPSVVTFLSLFSFFEAEHEVERGYLQNRLEGRESPPCVEIIQTWTRKKCVKHKLNYKRRGCTSLDIDRIWTIIEWFPYEVWCDSPQVGAPSSSWRNSRSSWSLDLHSFVQWWRSPVNRSEIIERTHYDSSIEVHLLLEDQRVLAYRR